MGRTDLCPSATYLESASFLVGEQLDFIFSGPCSPHYEPLSGNEEYEVEHLSAPASPDPSDDDE